MTLKEYKHKRNMDKTPEPKGKRAKASAPGLIFVVQKHAARHLHYDFRLELDGVLLSWAVPKGPSMNHADKRLAVHVEDHPLEYANFKGVIPEGNYGAGTVEIWDKGTYAPIGFEGDRKEEEKILRKQYREGKIDIVLKGKKLQGNFLLIKLKNDPKGKNWLLIKKEDHTETIEKKNSLLKLPKKKMPHHVQPMLATLVDEPFDGENWLFEVKWDGYRAIAEITPNNVDLYSRNFLSFAKTFAPLVQELKKFKEPMILDGEIVVLDESGNPNFQMMQNYLRTQGSEANLKYCVFDLLYYQNKDLRALPLIERKKWLQQVLAGKKFRHLVHSDYVLKAGISLYEAMKKGHYEGMMAKEINSEYVSKRSRNWLKVKTKNQQEAVIIGFTAPRRSRKKFGALILGIYKGKELVYAGHVGTGFDDKALNEIYALLKPLETEKCPLKTKPKTNMPAYWVKPKIICEVTFSEWTMEGIMRHPVFKGLRADKPAKKMGKEEAVKAPAGKKFKKSEALNSIATNAEKIFWHEEGYTKEDLLLYYKEISPYMVPHLKGRPIVMNRFPDGFQGKNFFQKEAPSFLPEWMRTVSVQHSGKVVHYLLIDDVRSLLYVANLGSIEIHPFASLYEKIDYPDYIVIDLDPQDVPFTQVIEVAKKMHRILNKLEIPNYCKTSGKRGLHLYIPLGAKYDFQQAEEFAKLIATIGHQQMPDITSLIRNPKERKDKIYLDYLQNNQTKTVVAPYSVRPAPHATVSTPLKWSEVKKGLDPQNFTIKTVPQRLKKIGDIFLPTLKEKGNLKKWIKAVEKQLQQ